MFVLLTTLRLDMIRLKDYELECMPLLKNAVNAYHFCVFLEIVTFESNYEGMCVNVVFVSYVPNVKKRDSMTARTFY